MQYGLSNVGNMNEFSHCYGECLTTLGINKTDKSQQMPGGARGSEGEGGGGGRGETRRDGGWSCLEHFNPNHS